MDAIDVVKASHHGDFQVPQASLPLRFVRRTTSTINKWTSRSYTSKVMKVRSRKDHFAATIPDLTSWCSTFATSVAQTILQFLFLLTSDMHACITSGASLSESAEVDDYVHSLLWCLVRLQLVFFELFACTLGTLSYVLSLPFSATLQSMLSDPAASFCMFSRAGHQVEIARHLWLSQ